MCCTKVDGLGRAYRDARRFSQDGEGIRRISWLKTYELVSSLCCWVWEGVEVESGSLELADWR